MASLNKSEASAIKSLQREAGWEALVKLLGEHVESLRAEPITGSNAFEELRSLHTKQGKIDGLLEFFDIIDQKAYND